MIENSKLMLLD